jgi:hypothetical protein
MDGDTGIQGASGRRFATDRGISMVRIGRRITVLALAAAAFAPAQAFDGVGLFTYKWTQSNLQNNEGVWLSEFGTGTVTKLWGKNGTGGVDAAAFSPDGLQIIFASGGKLHIMDNNGSRERILPLGGPCNPNYSLCWTTNGVFWVGGGSIWRYVVETNSLTELHHWDDLISGSTKGYWCSMDGRKGWCWAELDDGTPEDTHGDQAFITFNADWTLRSELRAPIWGHGNYMSHSGNILLFDKWSMQHQHIEYVRHSDAVPFDTVFTKLPSGSEILVFDAMQPCPNDSQLIMLATSPDASGDTGNYVKDFWVWNWVTESTPELVPEPRKADGRMMWKGPLPEVILTEPWLTCDRSEYVYWNMWGHTENIPITNTGGGVLGAITVDTIGGNWLTISVSSSNDTQYVNIRPNYSMLPSNGVYKLFLHIHGGGAENELFIPIYKVHGEFPMVPEPVNAYPTGTTSSDVLVTWTNRDDKETGFEVQRRGESGTWTDVTTTAANATTHTDLAPGYGTFHYRVRAVNANGASLYSDSVEVVVSGVPNITVTAPAAGEMLVAGSTYYIEWTAHLINQVEIKYTTDDGEHWHVINGEGGVLQGNPDWGHYAWTVPDTSAPMVQIHIHKYGTPPEGGFSGVFSIGATGVARSETESAAIHATVLRGSPAFLHRGAGHTFAYSLAQSGSAWLQVVRLDGTQVALLPLDRAPGNHTVSWDGRTSAGQAAGRGMYVARLLTQRMPR